MIPAILLGARAVGGFLKSLPWQAYAVAAAVLLVFAGWHLHTHAVHAAYAQGVADERAAWKAAQAAADEAQRAKIATQAAKSATISKESSDALDQSTTDIRARADAIRVRHDAQAKRAPSGVDLSGVPPIAGQPEAPPACDGLAFAPALEVSTHAAEADAQINAILDWFEKQAPIYAEAGK